MAITSPLQLTTSSLQSGQAGKSIARILFEALQAVDPYVAVNSFVQLSGDRLIVGSQIYNLSQYHRVFVVGAGKAVMPMALATSDVLGEYIQQSLVVAKEGFSHGLADIEHIPNLTLFEAGHPLPDSRGVFATQKVINLIKTVDQDDLVICLISGGGSALLTAPAPGVTLADLQRMTKLLLACGASINEINTLRKHLDTVKGGGLVRLAYPAQIIALILSDVVGDTLDMIASGPTAPDPTTYLEAYLILERYNILGEIPVSIVTHLQRGIQGAETETLKPGSHMFGKVQNLIVGSNIQAARTALTQAKTEGFNPLLLTTYLQGEAAQVGRMLAAFARQICATDLPVPRPACLIAGGETTVTLTGNGLGGRNQEMALGAVIDLAGLSNVYLVTLATDGNDGPTDAAGAVVTGETFSRALALGLNPHHYLSNHDSYHFFDPLGDLIRTGPTHTNVNDLAFVFVT